MKKSTASPDVKRLGYRPKEAADAIGVSLRKINDLIASGRLELFKVGRCRRVKPESLTKSISDGEAA